MLIDAVAGTEAMLASSHLSSDWACSPAGFSLADRQLLLPLPPAAVRVRTRLESAHAPTVAGHTKTDGHQRAAGRHEDRSSVQRDLPSAARMQEHCCRRWKG